MLEVTTQQTFSKIFFARRSLNRCAVTRCGFSLQTLARHHGYIQSVNSAQIKILILASRILHKTANKVRAVEEDFREICAAEKSPGERFLKSVRTMVADSQNQQFFSEKV